MMMPLQRSVSGESILTSISGSGESRIDPAIRKQVVHKLAKARGVLQPEQRRFAELEEEKMHRLVVDFHSSSSIASWELTLQYERCMEKHIDLITSHTAQSQAPTPVQLASKRVLREYSKYIHFGLSSPVVPVPCKRVLQDIVKVLEKCDLTVTGVRRVENSLKLLKVKIDHRCEEINACNALVKSKRCKRKAEATPRGTTPRDPDQSSTTAKAAEPNILRRKPLVESGREKNALLELTTQTDGASAHLAVVPKANLQDAALLAQIKTLRHKGKQVKRVRRDLPPPLQIEPYKHCDTSAPSHSSLTPIVAALEFGSGCDPCSSRTHTPLLSKKTQVHSNSLPQSQSQLQSHPHPHPQSQDTIESTSPSQKLVRQERRFVAGTMVRQAFRKLLMADSNTHKGHNAQDKDAANYIASQKEQAIGKGKDNALVQAARP